MKEHLIDKGIKELETAIEAAKDYQTCVSGRAVAYIESLQISMEDALKSLRYGKGIIVVLCLLLLYTVADATKLVSCPGADSGDTCTASMVSINGVTPTTIWTDQALTEITDPGAHGKSDYVADYGSDLDPALEYRVFCNCSSSGTWMYAWEPYETRVNVANSTLASSAEVAKDSTVAKDATVAKDSTVAKEATLTGKASQASVDALGAPMQAASYVAPDNAGIAAIPTNPLLDNDVRIPATLIATSAEVAKDSTVAKDATVAKDSTVAKEATLTGKASQASVDALGAPMQAASYVAPDNEGIAAIPTNPLLTNDARIPATLIASSAEVAKESTVGDLIKSAEIIHGSVSDLAPTDTIFKVILEAPFDNVQLFDKKAITFIDGDNNRMSQAIDSATEVEAGVFELEFLNPWPAAPSNGDAFLLRFDMADETSEAISGLYEDLVDPESGLAREATLSMVPTNPLRDNDVRLPATVIASSAEVAKDATVAKDSTVAKDATVAKAGDSMTLTAAAVDAILDEVVEGTDMTMRKALRIMLSSLAGKVTGGGTTTITFRDIGDTKPRITATVDSKGNRTAVTINGN